MFVKTAKVPIIAIAEAEFDDKLGKLAFKRTASQKHASVYQADSNKIDIRSMLEMVGDEYNISKDPRDYIFEAVRAVTAEVPNENGDAFPRGELLRFDHRLGKAVYQTFIGKPHHINHRADNPKTSRGVVLDASYNDLSPALENCPDCNHRTAEASGRDETGINCIKCGSTVKDEFVELLLAVDTKKDPTFAEGVKAGALDSLSMGCEAGYTDCSICDNRARSTSQFCQHIKSGNKKKMFKSASGMKMSFEKCGEVIFTEISRVDQPADPTAKQREIFQIANVPMSVESEMLVMASKIAKLEQMTKSAQLEDMMKPHDFKSAESVIREMFQVEEKVGRRYVPRLMKPEEAAQKLADPETIDLFGVRIDFLRKWDSRYPDLRQHLESKFPGVSAVMDVICGKKIAQLSTGSDAGLVEDVSPRVPFKNLAESIKWAEGSVHKLKAEVSRLVAEKGRKHKEASDEGRPFYAWENAAYDAQIKASRQYIARLEDYVAKAREMQASGAPWEKGLTRQMSRFFAEKQAQAIQDVNQQAPQLEELKVMHPELAPQIDQLLQGGDAVPEPMSIDDYAKKREETFDQSVSPGEMGMKLDESGGLPTTMASKVVENKIASDLDALMDSVKEYNVSAEVKSHRFADSYKDLEATVTKGGNVRVHTAAGGLLFVVRPEVKPADKQAAEKVATEILANIAEHGIVETVEKYQTVLGPKMAQVLEHHLEDFAEGREEGDKKGMPEGGETDGVDAERGKPEKSVVKEETTDRKDKVREKRDQSNADVLEKHQPDHAEALPAGFKPAADQENSDMADGHGKPAKSVLKDITVDFKDKQPKSAQLAPPPGASSPAPTGAGPAMAAPMEACACMPGKCACDPECAKCDPTMSKCGCPCGSKMAQDMAPSAPAAPAGAPAPSAAPAPMPMAANLTKQAAEKHASRLERLYKARLEKVQADAQAKVAAAEKTVSDRVTAKLLRALKLAAKRQELNLESSPIKEAMFDVLTAEAELDAESFYPGMDEGTAAHIVEATTSAGFENLVASLVKRASEFMAMNEDAFSAIESDVKNIRPAGIQVTASQKKTAAARADVRTAAEKGNFVIAPGTSDETIPDAGNRNNIRSALGTTKVRRTSEALLKR